MGFGKYLIGFQISLMLFFYRMIPVTHLTKGTGSDTFNGENNENGNDDKFRDAANIQNGDISRVFKGIIENVEMFNSVGFVGHSGEIRIYRAGM